MTSALTNNTIRGHPSKMSLKECADPDPPGLRVAALSDMSSRDIGHVFTHRNMKVSSL